MIMIQANKEVLTFNFMSTQKGQTKEVGGGGKFFMLKRKYPVVKQREKKKDKVPFNCTQIFKIE